MKLGQSKWVSLLEANTNTFIGFFITLLVSPLIYTLVGITYTFSQLWVVTMLFTLISVLRGYVIRRWFNKSQARKDKYLEMARDSWHKHSVALGVQIEEERHAASKLIFGYQEEIDMLKMQYSSVISDIVEANPSIKLGSHVADVEWNSKNKYLIED